MAPRSALRHGAVIVTTLLLGFAVSLSAAAVVGVTITVKPAAVAKKASIPAPPTARPATVIGAGALTVHTANSPMDTDATWVEKFDIDGDGNVEEVTFLWDDEHKMFYAYADDALPCPAPKNAAAGKAPASGPLLVGVNGDGNPHGRPAGSGYWVVALDAGECGASTAMLWGCKFDAMGKSTVCGQATIDEKNDDLTVAAAH